MKSIVWGAALACVLATPALAAPGLGSEIYAATVEKGEPEIESRWDSLRGGPDDGEDVLKIEAAYGLTDKLRIGIQTELEREPAGSRKAEEASIEAIYELGDAGGFDFAAYGEYAVGLHGNHDAVEAKLLVQRKTGPWDLRLNLIAEKPLEHGAKIELGYAASADVAVAGELRVGVEAFGELGTFSHFAPRAEHFIGPAVKAEIEGLGPEIEIGAGYLFAVSKARDDTKGQLRFGVEVEF